MNRHENKTVKQYPQRMLNKVTIAIAIVAFSYLSACPEQAQAQRLRLNRAAIGPVAEKPRPPLRGTAANAPMIVGVSEIDKRHVTIRIQNFAADVSKLMLERRLVTGKGNGAWFVMQTFNINDHLESFDPSVRDHRRKPGGIFVYHESAGLAPGDKYQYRVRAIQPYKPRPIALLSAVRTLTVKHLELPKAPSNLKVVATHENRIVLSWTDNAYNETGHYIRFRKNGTSAWRKRGLALATSTSGRLMGLAPNTEYELIVVAENLDGGTASTNRVVGKTIASNAKPATIVTKMVYLGAKPDTKGLRVYFGSSKIPGVITKIEIPELSGRPYQIYFVKPGHSAKEYPTNPDATVMMASGQASTWSQVRELFGTAQKKLPLKFVACVETAQGRAPNSVGIKVTYIKMN